LFTAFRQLRHGPKTRYGWVASPCPTGTCTPQEMPSLARRDNEIAEATEQGNQSVKLTGIDSEGDILRGNNEKFQLRKPLEDLSSQPVNAAKELYKTFLGLIEDGLVKVPETPQKARAIVESLVQRLF